MQSDIKTILQEAEDHYLQEQEVKDFRAHAASLAKRLEIYEHLREREIEIFQPIAVELFKVYPGENPLVLEKVLKQWLSIMRYGAMAMLLNNPEYFQRSILEWLTETVQAHQTQPLENTIYDLLFSRLKRSLSKEKFAMLQPFLEQAHKTLLSGKIMNIVGK